MKRGLGSPLFDREENRARALEIRRKGARALNASGKAHRWTAGPDGSARIAGIKGGEGRAKQRRQAESDEEQAA